MKTTRRTKIRLEKHELKLVRYRQETLLFCQSCQAETKHLPVAQIATMLALPEKTVFRLVESEKVHSTETVELQLLICADSAADFAKKWFKEKSKMIYEIGCTLTVQNTGIECNIIIKQRREGDKKGNWGWEKTSGRLDIGSASGDWMHGLDNRISLVKSAVVNSPDWTDPSNWLVELYGVPDRFIDDGIYGSGEGLLNLTREKLKWKMWSPYI